MPKSEPLPRSEPMPKNELSKAPQRKSSESSGLDRRSFFGRGAVVTSVAFAGFYLGSGSQDAEAQTTGRVSLSDQMKLVQAHENAHVTFLVQALGTAARPKPNFRNITSPNVASFLSLGRGLENTGVGAYLAAAPAINNPACLAAPGSIATIEARHAGIFNSLQARPMTENALGGESAFEQPLTAAQVASIADVYIQDLNGGPPLTYSTTRSDANDIAILNFALALEYLEAEYYNINVPRFYR